MAKPPGRAHYDAALHLLDRQIVDPDGRMVAKVDDLELQETDQGRLVATAILTGPAALGPRLRGHLGAWSVAVWGRLRADATPRPGRIGMEHVAAIDSAVHLDLARSDVNVDGLEQWVETRVIRPLPGSGHAPE
jgi:hypothetical protein